jgi:chromosomal replication initiation ATPase DnaA
MKKEIFNQYTKAILSMFRLKRDELFTKNKKRDVVDARNLLYFVCANRQMKLVTIQEYMAEEGYKISHTTIIHSIKRVQEQIVSDKDYLTSISKIESCIL